MTSTPVGATVEPTSTVAATPSATPEGQYSAGGVFIPYPPSETRWMDKDGFLNAPQWDDRNLSPEEKAADPVHDPRWPALVRCTDAEGFGAGLPAPEEFVQADLDALVEEINQGGPFVFREDSGRQYRGTPASDAFTQCAEATLTEAPSGER